MMHYHRSKNEPHKSLWHLQPHITSKRTAALLKDAAYPQSKRAMQGYAPVGFCQSNHLLSLLLQQTLSGFFQSAVFSVTKTRIQLCIWD